MPADGADRPDRADRADRADGADGPDGADGAGLAASCADLVQIYPSARGGVTVLRGIDARFPAGSVTAVVGASGAGKSTLLRLLACLEAPSAGQVTIAGEATSHLPVRARRRLVARRIGYVFQRPADNLIDYLTVRAHLRLAWQMRRSATPLDEEQLLATAALADAAEKRPGQLSDGQQQRLAVAMAVAGRPDLVIADEPTAELDPPGAAALAESIVRLARAGQTFIVSSHDPVLTDRCDQVLVVRSGVLAGRVTGANVRRVTVDPAGRIRLPEEALRQLPDRVAELTIEGDIITLHQP